MIGDVHVDHWIRMILVQNHGQAIVQHVFAESDREAGVVAAEFFHQGDAFGKRRNITDCCCFRDRFGRRRLAGGQHGHEKYGDELFDHLKFLD